MATGQCKVSAGDMGHPLGGIQSFTGNGQTGPGKAVVN